jgi:hypothetical protein
MRYLMIFCLAFMLAASPALAADLFVKKNKDNALPDTTIQQTAPVAATPAPPAPEAATGAEPETMESFAERYNQNCLKKTDAVLKGEPLRMLCACSASKLQETMTVDEVKLMMTDTPEGLAQRNRMAINVYAPCMEYPVRAMLYHNCAENKDVLSKYKNADQICTCMADDMADFTQKNGPDMLRQNLAANPNDPDPLSGLMQGKAFQDRTQASFLACVGRFPITP